MSERIIPQPENNQVCPPADYSIREFYKEDFESTFIILHPFFKVTAPEKIDFNKNEYPSKSDMAKYCEKIKWSEFLNIAGISNIKELDIALRNSIHGLHKRYENKQSLNKLVKALEKNEVYQPNEGFFDELLLDNMMKALLKLDFQWIFIGDEFGMERKMIFIEDIIDNKYHISNMYRNFYTPKNEVLYSVHWDSHFTLLSSSKENIDKMISQFDFEGFYCNEKTEIYWSVRE